MRLRPLRAWGPKQLASHGWDVINIDGPYITVGSSEGLQTRYRYSRISGVYIITAVRLVDIRELCTNMVPRMVNGEFPQV